MSKQDIQIPDIGELVWDAENQAASLEKVISYSRKIALDAYQWYLVEKKSKKQYTKILRIGVIVSSAIAGILPIISEILRNAWETSSSIWLSPAWASVAVAIAGTLILFDRFFGVSSGWMRYIEAMMKIRTVLNEFDFDCVNAKISRQTDTFQIQQMVIRCNTLVKQVNLIVLEETRKWDQEFRDALGKLDEQVQKLEQQSSEKNFGALNVVITNRENCEGDMEITVDNAPPKNITGKTAAFTGLMPGTRVIRLKGKIAGKTAIVEKAAIVDTGKVTEIEIPLA